jgi:hypothetical protein
VDFRVATFLVHLSLVLASLLAAPAWASDCSVSREFEIRHSQTLLGRLQDPQGLALSGTRIELLLGKVLVRRLTTDNLGSYDFGEFPPGRYRIQIQSPVFCAPQVICKAAGCTFSPKLKLKPKNMVMVY